MTLRVGIFGRGRLGSAVAAAVETAADLDLAWTAGLDGDPAGRGRADVALDLSHAAAVPLHLRWALATGTDLVIGATGWDRAVLAAADDGTIGVLTAPNFSLSAALMRRLSLALGRYAAQAPVATDLAVSEVHHSAKVDAPSGTAVLLRRALAEGAGRDEDAVQTTSLRLGAVVGRHDVRAETHAERIVLTHEALSRDAFVPGALAAARWVHRRRGIHSFDDLAAEVLDPLFASTPPTQKEEP